MYTKKLIATYALLGFISGLLGSQVGNLINNDKVVTQETRTVVVEESDYVDAIETVSPSVVSIIASKNVQQFFTSPDDFFNPFAVPRLREVPGQQQEIGGGTGFVVSEDGLVVTNKHVISDEEAEYTVIMNDGKTYFAEVLSKDPANDLAVIQLFEDEERNKKVSGLTAVKLGDSDTTKVGSQVLAIGNALAEFENTSTAGIISAKGRQITAGNQQGGDSSLLSGLLQTDAAINPGNSGGPLVNIAGMVIGVNTAVASDANGIGFAIPINDVKPVIESIKKYGKIVRPYLGVRYTQLSPQISAQLNLDLDYGAYLSDDLVNGLPAILADSPAARGGLKVGDIITNIENKKLNKDNSLQSIVRDYQPDDEISVTVWRDDSEVTLTIKLGEFKNE
jgi:S1-C subfamily serine protease